MERCNTCGGTYEPILPDGTRYFHACPPLSAAEVKAAIAAGASPLTVDQQTALDRAKAADTSAPVKAGEATRADQLLGLFAIPRPNARDENVVRGGARDGGPVSIKAEGQGTTKVPPPAKP